MAAEQEKGMNIFLDVFRRADKNDDGALSWEEFKSFFADGVLSQEELSNLFHEIDTHNTNNIDTGELCTYFSSHLGPFKAIFSALDDLMPAVSEAVRKSAQDTPSASVVDQFVTRFLLREILQQMSAIEVPLDNAFTSLDAMATDERPNEGAATSTPVTVATPQKSRREINEVNIDSIAATGTIIPGRIARRARRQISSQTSWGPELNVGQDVSALGQQIERLRTLVDRMENKVNFDGVNEEEFPDFTDDKLMLVVQRKMTAFEEQSRAFNSALRRYVEETNKDPTCLHIQVRGYRGTSSVMVYEIWQSEEDWKNNVSSAASKAFRHSCVDLLEIPESSSTLTVPDSWWPRD